MPLVKLSGFIFTIHPTKVKPELREKLNLFRQEIAIAIDDYCRKGFAVNPRFAQAPAAPSIGADEVVVKTTRYLNLVEAENHRLQAELDKLKIVREQPKPGKWVNLALAERIWEMYLAGTQPHMIAVKLNTNHNTVSATMRYLILTRIGADFKVEPFSADAKRARAVRAQGGNA